MFLDNYKHAEANELFDKAFLLQQQDKLAEAVQAYQEVVCLDRNHVAAWNNLAGALRKLGHFEAAAACAKRAVDLCPQNYSHLSTYGNTLVSLDRKEEALAVHAEAFRHYPDDFITRKNYALALRAFRKYEDALFHFNAACALEPENPDIQLERAMMYLQLGRYEEGWKDFEIRCQTDWMKCLHLNRLRWDGQNFKGKTVLLCAEQGFGDTILCSRYIPMLKMRGGRIIFVCRKELHRLFQSIYGIDEIIEPGLIRDHFDYHISIMSLPGVFKTTLESIPPLPNLFVPEKPPPAAQRLLDLAANKFKIGIVWSGSVTFKGNRKRAVPVKRFLPFAETPGVQLYSLQKGPCERELIDAGAQGLILELGPHLNDFAETASVLKQLDLVIMTDSSVAHLAGSVDCPVWNLLPYHAYWLYLSERDDSPWYPSMTLIRQTEPGDWDGVFKEAAEKLLGLVSARKEQKVGVPHSVANRAGS